MRVLFVIAHLDKGGGQAIQCRQLFEQLRPRVDGAELLALHARSDVVAEGPESGATDVGRLRFPGGLLDLRSAIRQRLPRYDIVQAFDMYYALPAAKLARTPRLVVRLGSDPQRDLATRWGTMGRLVMTGVNPWLYSGAETVVNSPHLIPTVPGARVRCIPNGVDTGRFAYPRDSVGARNELGLPVPVPLLVYTGKILPRKNLEDAFWALTQFPRAHLLLVGETAEPYYGPRYFRSLMNQFATVAGRVHSVGEVAPARVPRYLEAADLFLFPSRFEGMPNSVLEALAAGLPVVLSANPAHTSLVDEQSGRIYRNREELRATLEELLSDENKRGAMGAAARRLAIARYSFDAAVGAYLELYRSMLR